MVCWTTPALLTPIIGSNVTILNTLSENLSTEECRARCEESASCNLWGWMMSPTFDTECKLVYAKNPSMDIMQMPPENYFAMSAWETSCNAQDGDSSSNQNQNPLASFSLDSIDPMMFNMPGADKDAFDLFSALSAAIAMGIEDEVGYNTSEGDNALFLGSGGVADYHIEHGVDVLSTDYTLAEFEPMNPIQCEWTCATSDNNCVGYTWISEREEGGNVVGKCRTYKACPLAADIYAMYDIHADMDRDHYGLPLRSVNRGAVSATKSLLTFGDPTSEQTIVTGLLVNKCTFPDEIQPAPITIIAWIVIGAIGAGVLVILVISLCACKKIRSRRRDTIPCITTPMVDSRPKGLKFDYMVDEKDDIFR